ncbi:MAG TPA: trypsin-like peptidase domain-containing protein, partial [Pyrinomonadaceae bacterium]|nr:trypsin-like peptidase domain-containing protein [Pyrinomonadaceae bacterium]
PAVVNIDTISAPQVADKDDSADQDDKDGNSNDNPLMEMFRKHMRQPARGVGSGFIVDAKGYILTNQHVIEDATRIKVRLQSGEELVGTVVGQDEETDVAVVKVDARRDLPTVRLGNSDDVQVGDWVLAVGSPFGLDQTVTAGIISTRERTTLASTNFQHFLQTDAAINRGNSGGPLVNMHGDVIGINSQIATTTGDYNGIGFALPSNDAAFVYRQLTGDTHRVRRGYLGVLLDSVKPEFARVYALPDAKGAIITDVREGPASKAGMQAGDIVVEFNGQPVTGSQDLISKVASTPVGQAIQLTYLRDVNNKLERHTVSVAVGERPPITEVRPKPASTPDATPKEKPGGSAVIRPVLGVKLSELTNVLANEKNLRGVRGLLVTEVDPGGLAADAGLREDYVIERVNRVPVAALADFERIVSNLKSGDAVVMQVSYLYNGRITKGIVQFTYQ